MTRPLLVAVCRMGSAVFAVVTVALPQRDSVNVGSKRTRLSVTLLHGRRCSDASLSTGAPFAVKGSKIAAFNRSMDTVSTLFPRSILNTLGPRFTTRNGPSYGLVSGRCTASTLTYTCVHFSSCGSILPRGCVQLGGWYCNRANNDGVGSHWQR